MEARSGTLPTDSFRWSRRNREQVLTQLARIKVMNLLAQKKEVTLDDKEKERAAAAGREYFTSLNSAEVTALNVTQDLITKMYEEYALAEKVYQTIVENVNPEVSDDEARTITVDMIRVSDSAKASQVLGKAKEEGVDFETLAPGGERGPNGDAVVWKRRGFGSTGKGGV